MTSVSLGIYVLNIGSALSIAISVIALRHLLMKIKLNAYIKVVLSSVGVTNCMGMLILWLSSLFILIEGTVKVNTCSIIITSILSIFTINNVMFTLMSVLRYWMSLKLGNVRILSKAKIFGCFLVAIFSICAVMGVRNYFLAQNAGPGVFLELCTLEFDAVPDDVGKFRRGYFPLFQLFIKLVGLFFDIQMLFFVRKLQKIAPISTGNELIPWKSSANDEKEDIKIPIQASILTTFQLFLAFGVWLIIAHFRNFWLGITAMSVILITHLPITLMVSIKKHKLKVKLQVIAQPPHGLHLHEDTELILSQNQDSNEVLEPAPENYEVNEDQIENQSQTLHELSALDLNKMHLTNVEERHKTYINMPVIK